MCGGGDHTICSWAHNLLDYKGSEIDLMGARRIDLVTWFL